MWQRPLPDAKPIARTFGLDKGTYCFVKNRPRIEGYNQERPHSSLGYTTPAACAAELDKQWPASLLT